MNGLTARIEFTRVLANIKIGKFAPHLVRNEPLIVADILAVVAGKSVSDLLLLSDSGDVFLQGYCSFDYFASDYVGETRTF